MSSRFNRHSLIVALLGLGVSTAALATPATPAERDTRITAHFAQADSNKDGKLSLDEFKAMNHQQHAEHAERRDERREDRRERMAENMQEKFSKADTNKDGQLSRDEFNKMDEVCGMGHGGRGHMPPPAPPAPPAPPIKK